MDVFLLPPPMYPTRASSRPLSLPKRRRNKCSTPQKQPAATVAFCALGGKEVCLAERDSGCAASEDDVVNGRKRRARKDGMPEKMGLKVMIGSRKAINQNTCAR